MLTAEDGKPGRMLHDPVWSSAIPAPLSLVMHLAKSIFQSLSLFPIARPVGQALTAIVFSVPKALAMLPELPGVSSLRSAWRASRGRLAKSRDPRDRNLNVGLPWSLSLSTGWRVRNCAGERCHWGNRLQPRWQEPQ
jgi:hypothetical protein